MPETAVERTTYGNTVYVVKSGENDVLTGEQVSVETGRRINGKPVNRSVNLGRLGTITYEKLFKGTHKIAEKMVELDTLAGTSTGYAAGLVANSYRGAMR